jgi:hypothetical protein
MAEDERRIAQPDAQDIGDALGTRPATGRDVAYGEGQLFSAGHGTARLEVFPQSGVTRLTAHDLRVELFGSPIAAVSESGVEFHRTQPDQEASLTVIPGGGVVFTFIAGAERTPPANTLSAEVSDRSGQTVGHPALVPQTAHEPAPDTTDSQEQPPAGEPPSVPLPVSAEPSPAPTRPASPAAADAEPAQAPRVQLSGRLGRNPNFRTTKTGTLVGRFPLAEHHEDDTTRWHTVLAFGPRAQQLQRRTLAGELTQGRQVDVAGYLHTNTRPGKDGRPRTVQEVYATAVTRH